MGEGWVPDDYFSGILLILWIRSPSKISEPWDNPFWEKSMWTGRKKRTKIIPKILDTTFRCKAQGQRTQFPQTNLNQISSQCQWNQTCLSDKEGETPLKLFYIWQWAVLIMMVNYLDSPFNKSCYFPYIHTVINHFIWLIIILLFLKGLLLNIIM